jgi:alkylhydroperoxidase family enzyme
VPEALYRELREHFSEKEAVDLTMAIIAINGWNRLAATFRSPAPGSYQPRK